MYKTERWVREPLKKKYGIFWEFFPNVGPPPPFKEKPPNNPVFALKIALAHKKLQITQVTQRPASLLEELVLLKSIYKKSNLKAPMPTVHTKGKPGPTVQYSDGYTCMKG